MSCPATFLLHLLTLILEEVPCTYAWPKGGGHSYRITQAQAKIAWYLPPSLQVKIDAFENQSPKLLPGPGHFRQSAHTVVVIGKVA